MTRADRARGASKPAEAEGPPPSLSNTAAAVLGMVVIGARSGYEIRRAAERSVRFFWALGPPQIYAELKRLEADGLIAGREEARGGRSRRLFETTRAGEDALRAWLTDVDGVGTLELRDPGLLRLFFADAIGTDGAAERVREMRQRSERALELFRRDIEPAAERTRRAGAEFPAHVARFGRELHEFIVDWCDRLEQDLGAEGQER